MWDVLKCEVIISTDYCVENTFMGNAAHKAVVVLSDGKQK